MTEPIIIKNRRNEIAKTVTSHVCIVMNPKMIMADQFRDWLTKLVDDIEKTIDDCEEK